MNDMFSLQGKIALVTGASYGIGFAMATGFANAGATIVFNDIKQELVDKGISAYAELGIRAYGYVCDVTDEAAVNAMLPGHTFIKGKVASVTTSSVCPKASSREMPVRLSHSAAISGLSGSPATAQCFRALKSNWEKSSCRI